MASSSPSIDEKIRVYIRQRPYTNDEVEDPGAATVQLSADGQCSYLQKGDKTGKSAIFKFDGCFLPTRSQEDVYDISARPIVESALQGYSGTIFAYGPTNSGKTYTMRGISGSTMHQGIMERCTDHLLVAISNNQGLGELYISYLQIYCEMVTDLLDMDSIGGMAAGHIAAESQLSIREKDGKVFVEGVKRVQVRSREDFNRVLALGDANRKVAETNMNAASSRSHTALMMTIRIPDEQRSSAKHSVANPRSYIESTLFLVDLAGSERATASEGQQYQRLVEGKAINLSLSSLGNCMNALAEDRKHIPYRDSKLTRLLQGSLGGGARTSVIVTLPPGDKDSDKMILPVLRFASRATNVKVSAQVSRFVDYESLFNAAQQKLDSLERDQNASLIASGLRNELIIKIDTLNEQIMHLKDENALLRRQNEAFTGAHSESSATASSAIGSDPVELEKYWRNQMQQCTDKAMDDIKATRSNFEAKLRTLSREVDQASAEILSLQNDLTQERTKHLATVGQAKDYQQRLLAAESEAQGRIDELLAERLEFYEAFEGERSKAKALEEELCELKGRMASSRREEMIPKSKFDELETLFCQTVERLTNRVTTLEEQRGNGPEGPPTSLISAPLGENDPRTGNANRHGLNLGSSSAPNAKRIQPGGRVMSTARVAGSAGSERSVNGPSSSGITPAVRGSKW